MTPTGGKIAEAACVCGAASYNQRIKKWEKPAPHALNCPSVQPQSSHQSAAPEEPSFKHTDHPEGEHMYRYMVPGVNGTMRERITRCGCRDSKPTHTDAGKVEIDFEAAGKFASYWVGPSGPAPAGLFANGREGWHHENVARAYLDRVKEVRRLEDVILLADASSSAGCVNLINDAAQKIRAARRKG